jgi:hypothetical protein
VRTEKKREFPDNLPRDVHRRATALAGDELRRDPQPDPQRLAPANHRTSDS